MSITEQRAAIKTLIAGADPASIVHDYERWTNEPQTYVALFQRPELPNTPLRGWVFGVESEREVPYTHTSMAALVVWRVRFVYALQDASASEKDFHAALTVVRDAFRTNPTLGGVCTTRPTVSQERGQMGLSVIQQLKVTLGPVLCHLADCRLVTQELIRLTA